MRFRLMDLSAAGSSETARYATSRVGHQKAPLDRRNSFLITIYADIHVVSSELPSGSEQCAAKRGKYMTRRVSKVAWHVGGRLSRPQTIWLYSPNISPLSYGKLRPRRVKRKVRDAPCNNARQCSVLGVITR